MPTITDFMNLVYASSENFFLFLLIIGVTYLIDLIFRKIYNRLMYRSSIHIRVDPTQYNFFRHLVTGMIYLVGMGVGIYSVPALRTISVSLFAGAGVLAVIVGFASQQAFSNMISGVFLVIFKPFRVGDRIKVGNDLYGVVEDITLRHTVIKDWKNNRIIIPNSKMSDNTIENYDINDHKVCKWLDMNISYDSDVNKAMKIMQKESEKHPNCTDTRSKDDIEDKVPKVRVRVIGYGENSVILRAYVWSSDPGKGFVMSCDLLKSIKEQFDKNGVEIPYPYRTIVYKTEKKRRNK